MFLKARPFSLTAFAVLAVVSLIQPTSICAAYVAGFRTGPQGAQRPTEPRTDAVSIQSSRAGVVTVVASKGRVRVGEVVRFTLSPANLVTNPRNKVTVDFGDGTRVDTRAPIVTHAYSATGHYKVYASIVSPVIEFGEDDPKTPRVIPSVSLVAKPSQADVGKPVTFNAQISSEHPLIKYRFDFGDGTSTQWQGSPSASHAYANAGAYLAYVDLGLGEGGQTKQVGGSLRKPIIINRPLVPVDPDPPDRLPGPVRLSANPTPVEQGKQVTLDARADFTNPNVRYRFVFGDGSTNNWQAGSRVTHEYSRKGNYTASVALGVLRNGRINSLSSDRQSVQVTSSAPTLSVELEANPIPATKGQTVTFNARPNSLEPNLRYRFVFGDGSFPGDWQTGSKASYSYNSPGDYAAHVEIGRWTNGRVASLATSRTKMISVTAGVIASASPSPGPGDQSTQPKGPDGATTNASPTPDKRQPPTDVADNWWLYILLAVLVIIAGYQFYRALLAPRTTFHANRDTGNAEVDTTAKGLEINSQVLLRPNVSEAQYLVDSDDAIVRSVRRENV